MGVRGSVDIFETYDRFANGKKVREDTWDYVTVPKNATAMREKYDIEFGSDVIPEDSDLIDRLFLAGVDMLISSGFYNTDMGRVLTLSEDDVWDGIKRAPKTVNIGSGNEQVACSRRYGNPRKKPVIQGGPTGAPVSEDIFSPMIQSYVQESLVDTLVSGVLSSTRGHPTMASTPWEIRATMAEVRSVRGAAAMCGRPGLGI